MAPSPRKGVRVAWLLSCLALLVCSAVIMSSYSELRAVLEETTTEEKPATITPEEHYASLHPVYTRCSKTVNMPEFTDLITRSCGDIHELDMCAEPCKTAMEEQAAKFGCCWETVLKAYKELDPAAENAWRSWQGTLSGKCGVTMEAQPCGDAIGERQYETLKDKVHALQEQQKESTALIHDLLKKMYHTGESQHGKGDLCFTEHGWKPCASLKFSPAVMSLAQKTAKSPSVAMSVARSADDECLTLDHVRVRCSTLKDGPQDTNQLGQQHHVHSEGDQCLTENGWVLCDKLTSYQHQLAEETRVHGSRDQCLSEKGWVLCSTLKSYRDQLFRLSQLLQAPTHSPRDMCLSPDHTWVLCQALNEQAHSQLSEHHEDVVHSSRALCLSESHQWVLCATLGAHFPQTTFVHPPRGGLRGRQEALRRIAARKFSGDAHVLKESVEPDFGVYVQKGAKRAGEKKPVKVAGSVKQALRDMWPWEHGAFRAYQHKVHLKPHTQAPMLADRSVKLKHAMQMAVSPVSDEGEGLPLWRSAGNARKIKDGKQSNMFNSLFGQSHQWGPRDDAGKVENIKKRHSPTSASLLSQNSVWAPDAGFLRPKDSADKKLKSLGINVDGGFQSWV